MMKRLLLSALLTALVMSAHAAEAEDEEGHGGGVDSAVEQEAPAANVPKVELSPGLLYEFLVAEIAGSRGQMALSADAYLDLAQRTRDPRVARRAAEIAMFGRRYDVALDAARLWSSLEPDAAQPRQTMIGLLTITGRSEELAAHLAQQLQAAGGDVGKALLQMHRVLARHPDKAAARRIAYELTEPYAGLAESHFARAQASYAAGDRAASLAETDRALSLRPDWEQAALLRAQLATGEAAGFLREFLVANPGAKEARVAYARTLVSQKRYADARQEFQTLLADNKDNGDAMYAVGVLSLQLGDLDEAEKQLKRLVETNHAEVNSARYYLGQIAEDRKKPDEALAWYGRVHSGNQYLPARMRMAHALAKQQKLGQALHVLRETTAANSQERAQLLVGEAQLLREAGRNQDAYVVLSKGLAEDADQPDLLYETALMAERVGKMDVVESHLRRLIELKPDHAHAYNALGYTLADRGERLAEAEQLIDKALELAPNDPFILDSKGWILFRRGNAEEAADVLKKALSLRPDPEIAAHLGEVLWSLGRKDEARKTWRDAMKDHPDNEVLVGTVKKFEP